VAQRVLIPLFFLQPQKVAVGAVREHQKVVKRYTLVKRVVRVVVPLGLHQVELV
jgi:hypothetical protein